MRWREARAFPGTRASKPVRQVAQRATRIVPLRFPRPARSFAKVTAGSAIPPASRPPPERGGVPLQNARREAGLRMGLPSASPRTRILATAACLA